VRSTRESACTRHRRARSSASRPRCRRPRTTPLSPVTPYGVAKAYGHFIIGSYRRRYGLHASGGILYNHESPRRPVDFLPSKVANAAAAISLGLETELRLGDLSAQRDWGYARDYVEAMWRIVRCAEPGDYVIATGELHQCPRADRDRLRPCRARLAGPRPRGRHAEARAGGAPPSGRRRRQGPQHPRLAADHRLRGACPTAGGRRRRPPHQFVTPRP